MVVGEGHRAGGVDRAEELLVVGEAGEGEELSFRDLDFQPPRNDEVGAAQSRASLAEPLAGGVDHDVDVAGELEVLEAVVEQINVTIYL